jgi:hypothetical protein
MYSKQQIVYSNKALISLQNVLNFMSENCIYRDSWIYKEDKLVEDFVNDLQMLWEEIKQCISYTINDLKLFWVVEVSTELYEITKLVVSVRSYNIILICKRYLKEDIVFIEEMIIRTRK